MNGLSLKGIHKSFGIVETIKGIDLEVAGGEFVVFVGPSGCGKSTLLRMISGLEDVTAGSITIGERDVTRVAPAKRGVAMVFQSYALFPHMTVAENISFGLRLSGTDKAEVDRRVREVADTLQITPLLERRPKQLSGGQRQRVAIGRAIIRNPNVFLFDEPLSNLDAALRVQMRVEIARLHSEIGATMVYVTHDQVEAMTMADRIVVMNAGMVEQIGTPLDLYEKPANRFVAEFIGQPKINFVAATVASANGKSLTLELPGGGRTLDVPIAVNAEAGAQVDLGFRPDNVTLCDQADGEIAARVEVVEHLGSESIVHLEVEKLPYLLTVVAPGKSHLKRGEVLGLKLDAETCHLFDTQGLALS